MMGKKTKQNNFFTTIYILHLSSMAELCLICILGKMGALDFRQLSCNTNIMTKKERVDPECLPHVVWMEKLTCATYDTLDAVKMFLGPETKPFILSNFTSIRVFYLK